ncbi:MAG: 4Fe-4S dicluster domain-containing protein [Phycisphaerae bacterium]
MASITPSQIQSAGVVGAGGAGFPTYVKLSARADTVILNAAECEPLLHKDKELLRSRTGDVLAGLATAVELTGAKRAIIGIKEKYRDVIELLAPLLGADTSIMPLADSYPAGDEFILVYSVLGRVVPPGGIPLNVGAVVMNVETAVNVAAAPRTPVVEKYISVAGAVQSPMTLRVPVGVSMEECVAAAGGPTVDDPNYIVGGVMMGYLEPNHAATVDRTTGAVIVLPASHTVTRRRRRDWAKIARIGRSACDQCSFCTELCPRYLLGHPVEPHRAMRSLGFDATGQANFIGTSFCCECNLCSMYSCPEDLDPKNVCSQNKRRLAAEGVKWPSPPTNPARPAMHLANRSAPTRRLMAKLDLLKFNNVGPLAEGLLQTRKVGIKLRQHLGAGCEPAVSVGQGVERGQVVGRVPAAPGSDGRPAMGVPVHASIAGRVTAIENGIVWIER